MNYQLIEEFFREHGHYGLIRDGEFDAARTRPLTLVSDQLPPVDISALPESLGVRRWMTIEDQGRVGACRGHALTSVCELGIYRETGQIVQLNRMFAYLASQYEDGIVGDRGSTLDGGIKAATKGLPLEEHWPYPQPSVYRRWSEVPRVCHDTRGERVLRTAMRLRSYDDVLRWIVHGIGGVDIGIGWNASCEPGGDGTIRRYRPGGGGHAVSLLDWNRRHTDGVGRPFIELFNSWGRQWGDQGTCWVHPDVVEYWAKNETVYGYSDMDGASIKPRRMDWSKDSFLA